MERSIFLLQDARGKNLHRGAGETIGHPRLADLPFCRAGFDRFQVARSAAGGAAALPPAEKVRTGAQIDRNAASGGLSVRNAGRR
jgi:hypothetical protein